MFMVMLDDSVDLSRGELLLHFGEVSADLNIKIEARDARYARQYSASRRMSIEYGQNRIVRVTGKQDFDGLRPGGWQPHVSWPLWDRIQFVGVVIEARYNRPVNGTLRLDRIEYVPVDGPPRELALWSDRVFTYEYAPAGEYRQALALDLGTGLGSPPEVIVAPKRDDPSTALFLSGAGYKIDLDPLSAVGFSSQASVREEPHRIDGLLLQSTRMLRSPGRNPALSDSRIRRAALSDPVRVRSVLGSVIFQPVDETGGNPPRLTLTYEDVEVESHSSIRLDFRQQVHETALLWTTPYLDEGRRYRISIEPAYQYWKVTSDLDPFARLDRHRGIISAVLHDEWAQQEFFVLALFGRSNHKEVNADEDEQFVTFEWRKWYGREKLAFSTVGVAFGETDLSIQGRPDDQIREFRAFASLITEVDPDGRWRWSNEAAFNRTNADILIFFPTSQRANVVFDFWRFQSRVTYEVVADVDVSLALEHDVADTHQYDSVGLAARVSFFNAGPFRGELGARQTWYYNLDDSLASLFLQIHFAR